MEICEKHLLKFCWKSAGISLFSDTIYNAMQQFSAITQCWSTAHSSIVDNTTTVSSCVISCIYRVYYLLACRAVDVFGVTFLHFFVKFTEKTAQLVSLEILVAGCTPSMNR